MPSYQEIDAVQLHAMLHGETPPLLVDVRSCDEVAKGMLAGARHIPLSSLESRAADLEGNAPLVFYCHSGIRSGQACSFMLHHGRANVFNLRGGILAWGMANYPILPYLQE